MRRFKLCLTTLLVATSFAQEEYKVISSLGTARDELNNLGTITYSQIQTINEKISTLVKAVEVKKSHTLHKQYRCLINNLNDLDSLEVPDWLSTFPILTERNKKYFAHIQNLCNENYSKVEKMIKDASFIFECWKGSDQAEFDNLYGKKDCGYSYRRSRQVVILWQIFTKTNERATLIESAKDENILDQRFTASELDNKSNTQYLTFLIYSLRFFDKTVLRN